MVNSQILEDYSESDAKKGMSVKESLYHYSMNKHVIYPNLQRESPINWLLRYQTILFMMFVSTEWITSGNIEESVRVQNSMDSSLEIEGTNRKIEIENERISPIIAEDIKLCLGPAPSHDRAIDPPSRKEILVPHDTKKLKSGAAKSNNEDSMGGKPEFLSTAEFLSAKDVMPCELVMDKKVKKIPVIPKPEYLKSYIDPTFGTKIIRITNPENPIPKIGRTWKKIARHHYSLDQAWSADQSLLVLDRAVVKGGKLFLDGKTYEPLFLRKSPGPDDRWHPTKPDLRIFVNHNQIGTWNVRTEEVYIIDTVDRYKDFKFGPSKGNPSRDGNRIGILAKDPKGRQVAFAYDLEKKYKYPDIFLDALKVKYWVTISPLGNYILVHEKGINRSRIYDLQGKQVGPYWSEFGRPSHFDLTIDDNGDVVAVGVSKSRPDKGRVIKRRLRDGVVTRLTEKGYAVHTCARNIHQPGWVYVSYQIARKGSPYNCEVVAVKLDGSLEVRRLFHSHYAKNGYLTETHPSVSPDGTKVIWASNWDDREGSVASYVAEICDKNQSYSFSSAPGDPN